MLVLTLVLACRGSLSDTGSSQDTGMGTVSTGQPVFSTSAPEACTACGGACTGSVFTILDHRHIKGGLDYPDRPPGGNPHDPCWAPWGVHTDLVRDENFVHNLEHGGIDLLYNCPDGCAADVATLTSIANDLNVWVVLTPYTQMTSKFAMVSWEHRVTMDCVDEPAIKAFYEAHVDQATEHTTSDPPASCATEWDP